MLTLPRSLCERLRKTLPPGACADNSDALERAIVALLGPELEASPASNAAPADFKKKVGPEVHGGPEGQYMREASTGRWRSVSRPRSSRGQEPEALSRALPPMTLPRAGEDSKPVETTSAESFSDEVDRLQKSLMAEFEAHEEALMAELDVHEKSEIPGDSSSEHTPNSAVDFATARAAAKRARAEVEKLWEAVKTVVKDPRALSEVTRRDAVSRAVAEAEFEKQRLASAWDLIRANVEMKSFAAVTRKASGCEGERALSVSAARRLFGGSATPKAAPRTSSREPRRQRNSSRDPHGAVAAALGADTTARAKLPRPPSGADLNECVPRRPALGSFCSRPNVMLRQQAKMKVVVDETGAAVGVAEVGGA